MDIENKMEYALNLADSEFQHEFEDLFCLAGLCEEIAMFKSENPETTPNIEIEFTQQLKQFYGRNGEFRSEIERFPIAKEYIKSL